MAVDIKVSDIFVLNYHQKTMNLLIYKKISNDIKRDHDKMSEYLDWR